MNRATSNPGSWPNSCAFLTNVFFLPAAPLYGFLFFAIVRYRRHCKGRKDALQCFILVPSCEDHTSTLQYLMISLLYHQNLKRYHLIVWLLWASGGDGIRKQGVIYHSNANTPSGRVFCLTSSGLQLHVWGNTTATPPSARLNHPLVANKTRNCSQLLGIVSQRSLQSQLICLRIV